MPACAVPGCGFSQFLGRKSKVEKRTIFTIRRPEFAKCEKVRAHRLLLRKFILSMRDPSKGGKIKHLLHKETVGICDSHFVKSDLIKGPGVKSRLRCGAIPCLNLPKSSSVYKLPIRKPPVNRIYTPPHRHKSFKDVISSHNKLSPVFKDKWHIITFSLHLQLFSNEEDILTPKFRITFDKNVNIKKFEIYGWLVSLNDLKIAQLKTSTLYSFLYDVEKISFCKGFAQRTARLRYKVHPILLQKNDRVILSKTYRSPICSLYCKDNKSELCDACLVVDRAHRQSQAMLIQDEEQEISLQCSPICNEYSTHPTQFPTNDTEENFTEPLDNVSASHSSNKHCSSPANENVEQIETHALSHDCESTSTPDTEMASHSKPLVEILVNGHAADSVDENSNFSLMNCKFEIPENDAVWSTSDESFAAQQDHSCYSSNDSETFIKNEPVLPESPKPSDHPPSDLCGDRLLKELCDVKATLNYALREIAHLHERVDQLASGNRELAGKTDDFILPLRKKKDVQELEKRLRDENVAYDMIRDLSKVGGNTLKDRCAGVMKRVMTKNAARYYNWCGGRRINKKKQKLPFSSLKLAQVVKLAIANSSYLTKAKEEEIRRYISMWLAYAGLRKT